MTSPPIMPISRGVRCPACGYHLVGLTTADKCPECGGPASQHPLTPLRKSDPRHLSRLRRGALLVVLAHPPFILAGLGCLITLNLSPTPILEQARVPIAALALVAASLSLTGWWLLTTPGSRHAVFQVQFTTRRVTRALAVAAAGLLALWLALNEIAIRSGSFPASDAATVVGWLLFIVSLARYPANLLHARDIAFRIPMPTLVRFIERALAIMLVLAIAMAALLILNWNLAVHYIFLYPVILILTLNIFIFLDLIPVYCILLLASGLYATAMLNLWFEVRRVVPERAHA